MAEWLYVLVCMSVVSAANARFNSPPPTATATATPASASQVDAIRASQLDESRALTQATEAARASDAQFDKWSRGEVAAAAGQQQTASTDLI